MLSITDLKTGTAFEFENQPYTVLYSEHSKMGRGGAVLRSKIKNLLTGAIIDKTFKGSDSFGEVDLERKKAQYLYKDEETYNFMDSTTFEQFEIKGEKIGFSKDYLKEGQNIDVIYYKDEPINVELPIKLPLEITYTEPGFKGDSVSNTTKPATLETGAEINVPLFIKIGDKIIVDTRTGKYVERAQK